MKSRSSFPSDTAPSHCSYSFDVDFPIECDDVYWDHPDPAQNFTQPPGQPSVISYFVCLLKLVNILTYIKRVIVSCDEEAQPFAC